MIRFPSKIDLWLGALLGLLVLGEGVGGLMLVIMGPERIIGCVLLFSAAMIAWFSLTTIYEIDDERLTVRSGPFRWRLPIEGIDSIVPTMNPLSSPALSLDRLRIEYRIGDKKGSIMISPREKEAFLRAIAERSNRLRLIDGERLELIAR